MTSRDEFDWKYILEIYNFDSSNLNEETGKKLAEWLATEFAKCERFVQEHNAKQEEDFNKKFDL